MLNFFRVLAPMITPADRWLWRIYSLAIFAIPTPCFLASWDRVSRWKSEILPSLQSVDESLYISSADPVRDSLGIRLGFAQPTFWKEILSGNGSKANYLNAYFSQTSVIFPAAADPRANSKTVTDYFDSRILATTWSMGSIKICSALTCLINPSFF